MDTILSLLGNEHILAGVIGVLAIIFAAIKRIQVVKQWQLTRAIECLESGVRETYESYVRVLKNSRADGKLTDAERAFAIKKAVGTAKDYARAQGIDLLKFYGKEYLPVIVDKIVSRSKAPFTSAPLPELEEGSLRG